MRKHILSRYNDDEILNSIISSDVAKMQEIGTIEKKRFEEQICNGQTRTTRNIEDSDPDEFLAYSDLTNSSIITETVEGSDVDEKTLLGSTTITKTIEVSDPDEFNVNKSEKQLGESGGLISEGETMYVGYRNVIMSPTKTTFTVEVSDPDEFLVN